MAGKSFTRRRIHGPILFGDGKWRCSREAGVYRAKRRRQNSVLQKCGLIEGITRKMSTAVGGNRGLAALHLMSGEKPSASAAFNTSRPSTIAPLSRIAPLRNVASR
jgi:hypothetical protein